MARKTCRSLASFKPGVDGKISSIAVVLISDDPVVTMEAASPVEIKSGKVCGTIRKQVIDAAKFTVAGHMLDVTQAAGLRVWLQLLLVNFFDHEICTAYIGQSGSLLAKATMDGVPIPETIDQQVRWVSPDEGYTVNP